MAQLVALAFDFLSQSIDFFLDFEDVEGELFDVYGEQVLGFA
ncbi:MAG TPA: hypothetical protein VJ949_01625 [Cryomorphaceae bacterium]|nr:hypothetical protein [Cryomorphaceae bacterium]